MSTGTSMADSPNLQTTFAHTSGSLEYTVNHVFLPVEPPDADDYSPGNNHSLARAVCAAAHAYDTHILGTSEQDHWHRIIKTLDNLQASVQFEDIDSDYVISQLRGMQAGDILAFLIRRQNAGIILTRREDSVLCEAFEASPSKDAVQETTGPLSYSYPGSAAEIPNEVLDDRDFQLEFANFLSRPNIVGSDLPLPPPAHPRYIDILLDGVLQNIGRAANIARVTECGALHKRIRDRVGRLWMIKDKAKGVWRRSALWLLIRVTIQMSTNHSPGYASYKRFILFFMCTLASDAQNTSLSSDLHSMLSRILRRLSKLNSSVPDWLSEVALKTCDLLRETIGGRWKRLSVRPPPFRNPSQDELTRDTQPSLLNSREYIQNILDNVGHESVGTPFHPSHRHRGTIEDFLSSNGSFFDEAYDADPDATLYDFERLVEQGIDDWFACVTNVDKACTQLGILMDKYMTKAYEGSDGLDPEDISIRLLTAIELYVVLDKLVVKEIPMFADYPPGISTAFLEKLLLRRVTSLHRLSCAYQYLSVRHSRSRPGWSVLSDEFTEDSFPARYYDQSPHLQQLKARIEEDTMKKIAGRVDSRRWGKNLIHTYDGYREHQRHIPPQQLAENPEISQSPLPDSLVHAKAIAFELQCPACVRIWRSAAPCILNGCYLLTVDYCSLDAEEGHYLLANVPAFQPYFTTKCQMPPLRVQIHLAYYYPENSSSTTLRYVVQHPYRAIYVDKLSIQTREAGRSCRHWELSSNLKHRQVERISGPDELDKYTDSTSYTSNNVLATQADCPPDLSADEFIVFAHLRSGGSLQWLNFLQGLRCRTLNLRRREVHHLIAHAAFQVGPLDLNTGTWIWHQETQDSSFCTALLDELESFFTDVGASSIDGVLMNSISLLLTRVLMSSPSEDITERAIALLRGVRRKTFTWVQELSYDLSKAPMNQERRELLLDVTAACRSTFDIHPATFHKLFHSAEDVDAFLSCAFFIHAIGLPSTYDSYLRRLRQRDSRLSFILEQILRDAILDDPSDYGVDLAVGRIFASHSSGIQRYEQLQYPNTCWLTCQTNVTMDQPSQTIHINLLDGALHVGGRSLGGSLRAAWESPECQEIFRDQGFLVVSSNLLGMDFTTLEHKVHFSLQDGNLVVRAHGSQPNEILELIPSRKLQEDLPPALIDGHVHWLNLSTKIIEIRPIKQLWEESPEHWRIDCAFGQYHVHRGCETLVDIRSPTWEMGLKCFECLNNVEESEIQPIPDGGKLQSLSKSLLITTSLVPSASISWLSIGITLPSYGLSFFVNEGGELESHDFKDMVYDENQCIETLFSLENLLVLRPKTHVAGTLQVPEALIHRRVLIPNGCPTLHGGNRVQINIIDREDRDFRAALDNEPLYHAYNVDTELGCLVGNGSLKSMLFLASLHAMTNYHQPDPLTGKMGAQAALHLLRSGVCRSIMKPRALNHLFDQRRFKLLLFPSRTLAQYPQVSTAISEIQNRHYWDRDSFWLEEVSHGGQEKHSACWIPSTDTRPSLREDHNYSDSNVRSPTEPGISILPCTELFPRPATKMTLDYLICNKRAPEPLPARVILHRVNLTTRISAGDIRPELDPLFSSLQTDSTFQQEYVAHLDASAQHVCAESRTTYGVGGENVFEELQNHYLQCRENYLCFLDILKENLGPQALEQSDEWPPVSADVLLRYLASTSPIEIPPHWKKCLIRLALVFLDLQRARRLLRCALDGLEEEFSKELENEGCDGWKPEEYPDWLLIQIQGNFLIRRAQAETAMEIMSPRSGENTVMQVNMGDGKSSVIIPIAAAALADGKQLVRVIVPKALTTQMFDLLVARLGGLTNRPIYYLPFSRTPEYDFKGRVVSLQIDDLHKLMSRCMAERGILLAQPEHVVSLKLMGVEEQIREGEFTTNLLTQDQKSTFKHVTAALSLSSGDSHVNSMFRLLKQSPSGSSVLEHNDAHGASGNASEWLKLQKWLYSHARDILDESDEILHARFQLVYTMGPQQHIDGYPDRWTITQRVLRLVKKHVHSLSRYAPDSIEYENHSPGSFPHVRIVRQAPGVGQRLISLIVEDVMSGKLPNLNFQDVSPPALRDAIRSFISDANVLQVPATAKKVEEYAKCSDQSHLWSGLLLLRGLFTSDILLFSLTERRWRVDYGPDLAYLWHPPRTMLAVPYRAKDMPASNTQFGHPDLTIILTCLSYYYAGLSEKQLRASFEILLDQDNPTAEYTLWIQDCESVPDSLLKLSDINLRSSEQWDNVIFPLFSTNQAAIDFYLSRVVFPKEAKGFPLKLSGSSWDLAEEREKLITGFSGTNDGRWLLPMSIAQRDLDHQKGTNARVLAYLLRSENSSYMVIHDRDKLRSTDALLRMVAEQQPEIRVLLDVGSQILDLSNRDVASAWLDISADIIGAIYFNEHDELMLDRCVVYLDHAHTRGTDIKFPIGSRAAVTLGPKVTKDALVQGCMRMRKLGHGHSVMFFAPPEVDHNIRAVVGKTAPDAQVTTVDILCWAMRETWSDIQQRAPYWAQQGMSHKSRYNAWSQFARGGLTRKELTDAWLQPELKSLADLYAPRETTHPSSTLSALDPEILQRCKNLGVLSLPKARMDEEQEREVHREREREREMELPPKAKPAQHYPHPDVKNLVKTGIIPPLHSRSGFQPVFAMLGKSSAATCDADVWSPRVLATVDFCRTIKPESTRGTIDQYLRPVQWILTSKKERDPTLVVLSPFEADYFMPDIRASENVHLHVYAPRTSQRMKPSDDLRLYSIPPLPSDWIPPRDLIDQLSVFAGQLYLSDYESYTRLCRFLDVDDTTVRRNLFNIPGSFEEMAITFSGSPLPSVMALLAIRSRGRPFAHTHMGKILQGQPLSREDFEESASDASNHSYAAYDRQISRDPDDRIASSPSRMECDAQDDHGSPSVSLQSYKRGLETAGISEGRLRADQQ
ncbi:hypothetical protein L210DRAFT_3649011 [Boletus edulis BED1]|uniref:ubiquitinyl hydrolase 1 n=1 Tax=Boletus edulis BED1 TaxID=1328754 RepID=A0AAD4BML2_BOLED|nr:hypothetical protein L210DRAFT_3649011 [Boletus edulis BED1]